jgi:dUTP pyrophosphatase
MNRICTAVCSGQEPKYAHYDDACADVRSSASVTVPKGGFASVPTGLKLAMSRGCVGLLFARSGLGTKGIGITHGVGVIDAGYRGEIKVTLHNMGDEDLVINEGDRIAQLMILSIPHVHYLFEEEEMFDRVYGNSSRGVDGFGSTGVK